LNYTRMPAPRGATDGGQCSGACGDIATGAQRTGAVGAAR